ncbi:hypothetical protein DFJ74DRAFT_709510 [Hyaloraphidium curvatum]|nr:hypothetical protein DFJ74DRAFT_709510 [Hyaloraphidium curvatum]
MSAAEAASLATLPAELVLCVLHRVPTAVLLVLRAASKRLASLCDATLRWRVDASAAHRSLAIELVGCFRPWVGDETRFWSVFYRVVDVVCPDGVTREDAGSTQAADAPFLESTVVLEPCEQRLLRCASASQAAVALWTRGVFGAEPPAAGRSRPRQPRDIYGSSALYGAAFTYDASDYTGTVKDIVSFDVCESAPFRSIAGFTVPTLEPAWLGLRVTGLLDADEDDFNLSPTRTPCLPAAAPPPIAEGRSAQIPSFLGLRTAFGAFVGTAPGIALHLTVSPARRSRGSPLQMDVQNWEGGAPIGSRLAHLLPGRLEVKGGLLVAKGCSGREEAWKKGRKVRPVTLPLVCTRIEGSSGS